LQAAQNDAKERERLNALARNRQKDLEEGRDSDAEGSLLCHYNSCSISCFHIRPHSIDSKYCHSGDGEGDSDDDDDDDDNPSENGDAKETANVNGDTNGNAPVVTRNGSHSGHTVGSGGTAGGDGPDHTSVPVDTPQLGLTSSGGSNAAAPPGVVGGGSGHEHKRAQSYAPSSRASHAHDVAAERESLVDHSS
jgi:hypothetical protein